MKHITRLIFYILTLISHSMIHTANAQEIDLSQSKLQSYIQTYNADHRAIQYLYSVPLSKNRDARFQKFYKTWQGTLNNLPFDTYSQTEKIDYHLLKNKITYHQNRLTNQIQKDKEIAKLLPFAPIIVTLEESRILRNPINPQLAAKQLQSLIDQTKHTIQNYSSSQNNKSKFSSSAKDNLDFFIAQNAARTLSKLSKSLDNWHQFHNKYDPSFTWWTSNIYPQAQQLLRDYNRQLTSTTNNIKDKSLIGNPIGKQALLADLKNEMIDYTPDELITAAEKEYAWCLNEMKKASRQLGYGDNWKEALNHVKSKSPPPGKQDDFIKVEALRAVRFVEDNQLVTVPELCKENWRMRMITERGQRTTPFFTGGEIIRIAYPTDTMTYQQKMMALRGNNKHFSRAVVHHELIPGHHLQNFYEQRYKSYRKTFSTPFYVEGWALHWELLLWDLDYATTPEDKIGLLFWRMHRCARIIVSLNFHLNKMTPRQMINFIVDKVGHEQAGATSEVRRFIGGGYSPLYQCGYLLGGMQIKSLHTKLVVNGKMSNRQFHDTILKQNTIPIKMVKAALTNMPLEKNKTPKWKFLDD